jgi:hypothetical protein
MMFKYKRFPFLNAEPGAAGGGDAPAGGTPAATPAGDPPAGGAPAAPATPASVLASGTPPAGTPPAAAAPGPNDWIPEKFRVMKDDGTMDMEASARKVEEHRSHLEKRLGAGDIPPKSADEYKVNIPEKLAEQFKAEDLAADPMLKSFMSDAHAAGMSQKQVDMVISQYLERLPAIGGALSQLSADECTATLKEVWKSDADYTKNVQQAYNAAKAYGGEDFEAILKDHGNDPRLVKMLASVGKELGEDRSAPAGAAGITEQTAESLQKTPAYWDKNHPDHAATLQKVQSFYERTYGSKPKTTGSMAFGTV